ncbi:MAG: patatin-like phospholipase family protein, partial [Rubrivivax sp.]|nr:patatin-like phospholipase family protein [Pyrinomonadaceae bacterium]
VAACSAGACVAALLLSGRDAEVTERWKRERGGATKNFEWPRLLAGRNPMRHEEVYRAALLHAFDDGGFERIREQPFPFLILTTAFPKMIPSVAAALLGICLYKLGKRTDGGKRDPPLTLRAGFTGAAYDARDCASPVELANLIIASSATPPFTSIGRFAGRRLLDGGIIETVPAFLVEAVPGIKRNVVLLTSPPETDARDGEGRRLYVGPSAILPLKSWDLTRPHLIDDVIVQGEHDADNYESRLTEFLKDSVSVLAE